MTKGHELRLRLLRFVLLCCGVTWGVAFAGVFVSWDVAERLLRGFGADPITYDPMLDYWLRMASGAFGLLGVGYFLLAWNPRRYVVFLPWAGWLMLAEGAVLATHGFRLGLAPFPFYGDISACLLGGAAILALSSAARADAG
jgi:hypothetical protein